MNILGIGIDIVSIERIRKAQERHGAALAKKVLNPLEIDELARAANQVAFIAKRFAAKEAAGKAFGTGLSAGLGFTDIVIVHDEKGKPALQFFGVANTLAGELGVQGSFLSISDEKEFAVAQVILVGG